ncbi:hypothetical protein PO909_009962, partial [Leuciscus waleckii]
MRCWDRGIAPTPLSSLPQSLRTHQGRVQQWVPTVRRSQHQHEGGETKGNYRGRQRQGEHRR